MIVEERSLPGFRPDGGRPRPDGGRPRPGGGQVRPGGGQVRPGGVGRPDDRQAPEGTIYVPMGGNYELSCKEQGG